MVAINVYLYDNNQECLFNGKSRSTNCYSKNIHINPQCKKKRSKKEKRSITDRDRDNFVIKSLTDAPCDEYTLVCIDRMISVCTSDQIYDCIEYCISHIEFDIFYLASWADRCDLYSDFHEVDNYKIVRTRSPHGMACLLFSPCGKKKFLEKIELTKNRSLDLMVNPQLKSFKVYTTTPSIIEFDITQSECDLELIKVCKCREVPEAVRPVEVTRRNTTTLNLLWFILVLIIIICLAGILLNLTNKSTYYGNYTLSNLIPQTPLKPVFPYNPAGVQ